MIEKKRPRVKRHPANPIIRPGLYDWRLAVTFNPGVIRDDDGRVYLWERTAGQLRPFHCQIGMLESDDGVRFTHVKDTPVFTPEMAGSRYGSVQDPRVVRIDGIYYMTYAYRPYAWNSSPTGVGVPESEEAAYPGVSFTTAENQTRSGLAVSTNRVDWEHHSWLTPPELDDRDVIFFPEKIGGRFWMLRRPAQFVGSRYGTDKAGIWISSSADLAVWSEPLLVAKPEEWWENHRIGGSSTPVRTDDGWLVLYHGVEVERTFAGLKSGTGPAAARVCYRTGAMLLDLADPTKVIARSKDFFLEPVEYYEKFGLYIPNVVFPTGNFIKDGELWIYYGCCDTSIALAMVDVQELVDWVKS